jgi:hypothetical protein
VLLKELDPKLVFLELDLGWVTAGGLDPVAELRRLKGRVKMVHLKDVKPTTKTNYALQQDPARWVWQAQLARHPARLRRSGLQHYFVEQEPPFAHDRFDSVKMSYDFLRRLGLRLPRRALTPGMDKSERQLNDRHSVPSRRLRMGLIGGGPGPSSGHPPSGGGNGPRDRTGRGRLFQRGEIAGGGGRLSHRSGPRLSRHRHHDREEAAREDGIDFVAITTPNTCTCPPRKPRWRRAGGDLRQARDHDAGAGA